MILIERCHTNILQFCTIRFFGRLPSLEKQRITILVGSAKCTYVLSINIYLNAFQLTQTSHKTKTFSSFSDLQKHYLENLRTLPLKFKMCGRNQSAQSHTIFIEQIATNFTLNWSRNWHIEHCIAFNHQLREIDDGKEAKITL